MGIKLIIFVLVVLVVITLGIFIYYNDITAGLFITKLCGEKGYSTVDKCTDKDGKVYYEFWNTYNQTAKHQYYGPQGNLVLDCSKDVSMYKKTDPEVV
ncbi:MAG: hypothetical protein AB1467_02570 [Candidatus Diapherotrites archaeon]